MYIYIHDLCVWNLDIPKGQAGEKHVYNIVSFRYIEVLSIHFTIIRAGIVVRYTEDFVN